MNITILGSGTCVPSLERYPCSVLIQAGDAAILLDFGPGIMGQLLKKGVHINDLDMIFLSHFHLDHCADLAPFIFATKYPGFIRTKPLALAGGTGVRRLYERLNEAYNGSLEMPADRFRIAELSEKGRETLDIEGLQLSWAKPVHKPESRSFRFVDSSGFSFVYSGDTDYSPDLIELARRADIMICESALPDDRKVEGHATPSVAGTMARKAGVKKLVLTHFYPECDQADMMAQCRKVFDGDIVLARDLMTVSP